MLQSWCLTRKISLVPSFCSVLGAQSQQPLFELTGTLKARGTAVLLHSEKFFHNLVTRVRSGLGDYLRETTISCSAAGPFAPALRTTCASPYCRWKMASGKTRASMHFSAISLTSPEVMGSAAASASYRDNETLPARWRLGQCVGFRTELELLKFLILVAELSQVIFRIVGILLILVEVIVSHCCSNDGRDVGWSSSTFSGV